MVRIKNARHKWVKSNHETILPSPIVITLSYKPASHSLHSKTNNTKKHLLSFKPANETMALTVFDLLGALAPINACWPRGYKTFFMLNSTEHEIYPARKC